MYGSTLPMSEVFLTCGKHNLSTAEYSEGDVTISEKKINDVQILVERGWVQEWAVIGEEGFGSAVSVFGKGKWAWVVGEIREVGGSVKGEGRRCEGECEE
ncbi:1,4-alpha-glucan branching protein [Platysternon megacephalum]|uniref:1,4-alpha-glucan branching protein n=1 Tax=Platysternon megacephalum TaxID=55544 RepID=A0A4D9DK84_9SAUR|nr:1,4-alpha-glucan branching protein [Platysternon megacephalum]